MAPRELPRGVAVEKTPLGKEKQRKEKGAPVSLWPNKGEKG